MRRHTDIIGRLGGPNSGSIQGVGMQHIPVASSNLKSIAYDPSKSVLEVLFKSGSVYQYYNVPVSVHEDLLGAESKGQHLAKYIKGKFPYRMILPSS
ncbi:KTSC domain-containing protein [Streptomyces virginiae]|uniref:KTSC domain-containing protein n=1 Tax=Streptomyces virginiae TaxID=1961 RepID=UPI003819550E